MITFVIGGARSGKSRFALQLANNYIHSKKGGQGGDAISPMRKAYIATAQALDEEMKERIEKHKRERSEEWITYEEPVNISALIKNVHKSHDVVLIDCLTLWLSNIMIRTQNTEDKGSPKIGVRLKAEGGPQKNRKIFWGSSVEDFLGTPFGEPLQPIIKVNSENSVVFGGDSREQTTEHHIQEFLDTLTYLKNNVCAPNLHPKKSCDFLGTPNLHPKKSCDFLGTPTSGICSLFIVSNEVGFGIVPDNALSRRFMDISGYLNQKVAEIADDVYLVTAGIPIKIK